MTMTDAATPHRDLNRTTHMNRKSRHNALLSLAGLSFAGTLFLAVLGFGMGLGLWTLQSWMLQPNAALAAEATVLTNSGHWTAFLYKQNDNNVCYMAANPVKSRGDYTQRGDVLLMVTHRKGDKKFDEVSVVAGYPYQQRSRVELSIDGNEYSLFTHGDRAWADDSETDAAIAKALAAGREVIVKGTSSRGTVTTDYFSLKGSSNAYKAINQACK